MSVTTPPLPTTTPRSKSGFKPPFSAEVESALDASKGIAQMGRRGTGKTTSVRKLASSRNKPPVIIPVHPDMQIEEVRGETVLRMAVLSSSQGPYLLRRRTDTGC